MRKSRRRNSHHHRKQPRIRRLTPPGAPPATLQVAHDASKPTATVTKYYKDRFEEVVQTSLSGLAEQIEPGIVTWIQVKGYGDVGALQELGESFGLHGLAMEDAIRQGLEAAEAVMKL